MTARPPVGDEHPAPAARRAPESARWQRPMLRQADRRREVGWLELFFDLVFVVIVAVLAHDLEAHLSATGLVEFLLKFMAVFWIWNAFTYYTERFESHGLESRLFTFLALLSVAGLAVYGEDSFGHHYVGFAASYLAARGLNIAMWLRAGYHEAVFRPVAARFATGFALAAVVVAASTTVDGTPRMLLWRLPCPSRSWSRSSPPGSRPRCRRSAATSSPSGSDC